MKDEENSVMKKKFVSSVLLLALCLTTACSKPEVKENESAAAGASSEAVESNVQASETAGSIENTEVSSEETKNGTAAESGSSQYAKYDAMIEDVKAGLKTGFDFDQTEGLGISDIFAMIGDNYDVLGYTQRDLNGDGTDELIFGQLDPEHTPGNAWDGVIFNIFTLKDGEMYTVANGWDRNRFYLCTDGTIANEGSGGAFNSSWTYYTLSGTELQVIESVFTDAKDPAADISWFSSDSEAYGDDGKEITEEEARKIIDGHTYEKLEFTSFAEN